jgi:hypothetical protein
MYTSSQLEFIRVSPNNINNKKHVNNIYESVSM